MQERFCLLPLLALAVSATVFAENTIKVCPNTQYPTIQSGVNAATPGATIEVCGATYTEQVTIAKANLTLQGQGAIVKEPATTNLSYGFLVGAPNVRITGFQITGFKDHTLSAGIYVNHVAGTQITNDVIYGNCNGVLLNQATNTEIGASRISQNPLLQDQGRGPCVTFAFDPNFQPIPGPDGYGIKAMAGRQNEIENNDVEQNGECGIQLLNDGGGSNISGNRLFSNTGPQISPCGNIDVRYSSGAAMKIEISENSVDTGSNGIMLVNSDHIEIDRNNVTRTAFGINVMDSNRNQIDRNNVNNNFTKGIILTGQFNEIDHNTANNNGENGIVITVDGCGDPCTVTAGQVFLNTWANTIDHNTAFGNGQGVGNIDVEDFSKQSGTQCFMDPGCNPNPPPNPPPGPSTPPPGRYTPGTFDFWEQNKCGASIPAGLCK